MGDVVNATKQKNLICVANHGVPVSRARHVIFSMYLLPKFLFKVKSPHVIHFFIVLGAPEDVSEVVKHHKGRSLPFILIVYGLNPLIYTWKAEHWPDSTSNEPMSLLQCYICRYH